MRIFDISSSIARYLAAFIFYYNLMLFAWAGFVSSYEPLYLMPMKAIWSERERDERVRLRKCAFRACFCGDFWTEHQKHSSLFCLNHILHKHAYTASIRSQPLIIHITQSHKCSKSFIHLLFYDAPHIRTPL